MTSVEWPERRLGGVVTLKRGYDLPVQDRTPGDFPIVSSSGVTGFHAVPKVKGPGVVTGRYGTLGEVFYICEDFWPLNTSLYVQDFKGNDPRFVAYFLGHLDLGSRNAAGAVPGVNRNHLHAMAVRVPYVPEQRRIAETLAAYDDLIEKNLRRMRILEEMARALYCEWFVDLRFPGHERTAVSRTHQRSLPNDWSFAKLKDLALVNQAQVDTKAPPKRILYIDIASVATGTIREVTPFAFEDAPGRARRIVKHGDILWSCVRPNRRSHVLMLNPELDTVASTGFAVLTATKVPYTFLYQATTTDGFVAYLTNHATGAAYPAVTARTFQDAEILVPPEPLLRQFAEVTVPQAELIALLQRQNGNLRQTRDLLLPRLLSGQLSLAEVDDSPVLLTESETVPG
ncbi:MAG: restriction endonuclease subunit S [Verrucomicrobiales bacterium]